MSKELIITEKISSKICQDLMLGIPLSRIAKTKDMPSLTKKHKSFNESKDKTRQNNSQLFKN